MKFEPIEIENKLTSITYYSKDWMVRFWKFTHEGTPNMQVRKINPKEIEPFWKPHSQYTYGTSYVPRFLPMYVRDWIDAEVPKLRKEGIIPW